MTSFWQKLPKPFFAMAPMADVSDVAFRALVAKCGKPDVMFTEFVSADGLYHTREIAKMKDEENPLLRDLQFDKSERPIVAQIFSSSPDMIAYGATLAEKLWFDGVDLNMGCPDRSIERQGAGAALIKSPERAREIIRAAKSATTLPISVKTRVGYNREILPEWFTALLEESPEAITLHLRTRKEMSAVPADWELMKKAVEIRNRVNPKVLLIGNGDVRDLADAREKAKEFGCDGVMLGRAIFGNPWLFERSENNPEHSRGSHSLEEKLEALTELAHGFEKLKPKKNFSILKKHIKAFVTDFDGAAEYRAKLMTAENASELEETIRSNPL